MEPSTQSLTYNWSNSDRMDQYVHAMEQSMVAATGKTMDEWVTIAKTCPETAYKKRLQWFKERHGIMQNRAIMIFSAAEGKSVVDWDQPETLFLELFAKYPDQLVLARHVLDWVTTTLPEATLSPRKAYLGIQNKFQFAVLTPTKAGLQLGIHRPAGAEELAFLPRLAKQAGGGDRIKHGVLLNSAADFNPAIQAILHEAFLAS